MEQRMRLENMPPEAMTALLSLEKYVRSTVNVRLLELIKVRASFLNGCAYCIDMHTTEALREGESSRRLFAVGVWRESPFFSETERAVLALTDAVTQIGVAGVSDAVWQDAKNVLSEKELADVLMAVVIINSWNRIAVSAHALPPPEPVPAK